MTSNFLLTNPLSVTLYHNIAKELPIIDFHNHLAVADLVSDRPVQNIAQLWVISDPYKHRALRILGTPEEQITGSADDFTKFRVWFEALPRLIGNPLYDWSVLELQTVFGFEYSSSISAADAWEILNRKLANMTVRDILAKFPIEYYAPCAEIADDLGLFDRDSGLCPSLRGDNMLLPNTALIENLGAKTGTPIFSLSDYLHAVNTRLDAFRTAGCRFSDHALDQGFRYIADDGRNEGRFARHLQGQPLSDDDRLCLTSYILRELACAYARHGFTLQLHIGAARSTSTRLRTLAGPAGGYAAIGSCVDVASLITFLDAVEQSEAGLPKILLFTLNPADNAVMATLCGSYAKDGVPALVSQGPAWWWCDHYQGICDMLDDFMTHSVLSTFIGMTTDSRSPLSFIRHDYFRRTLCAWVAAKVEAGRLPNDMALLSDLIVRMCYKNAKEAIL